MTERATDNDATPKTLRLPGVVWGLGLTSLFMDFSSEMIHSLLPVFVVSVLGAGPLVLGLIEGAAEAIAAFTKIASGVLSDALRHRKWLAVAGYGLAALTKPLFPLAQSIGVVTAARFLDRVGKGVRGAPRDALVADVTPLRLRGAAFGLRQSLDTVGAVLGPLGAVALMMATGSDIRLVFWIACLPALVSVLIIVTVVREPRVTVHADPDGAPSSRFGLRGLGRGFWVVWAVAFLATLARMSEAFLVLRAFELGLSAAFAPLVLVVMNIAYALSAYPAGVLSDRIGRGGLVAAGLVLLMLADLALGLASGLALAGLGVVLWGGHMGLTQGLFAALVTDRAPAAMRGRALGIFHATTGIALLLASVLAGFVWQRFGPAPAFAAGFLLSALAFLGVGLAGLLGAGGRNKQRAE